MLLHSLYRRFTRVRLFARLLIVIAISVSSANFFAYADEDRWSGWYFGATGLSQEIDDERLDGYGLYFGWGYQPKSSRRNYVVTHEIGLGIDDRGSKTLLWTSSSFGWQTSGVVLYTDAGISFYSWYGFPVGISVDLGVGIEIPVNSSVSIRAEYSQEITDDHIDEPADVSLRRAGIGLTYRF